ncbi:MAG: hypothetical protein AAGK21_00610, partial [Bacteroidota bacterium]
MPQTLLALAALVTAGLFTLSQVQTEHSTVQAVVQDQFELAVGGTLLHAIEFADSRAFDEFTTPERLRTRYGLPAQMTRADRDTISFDDLIDIQPTDFSPPGNFGGNTCSIQNPSTTATTCDDLDDAHTSTWQSVDLATADGSSIPVEVLIEVDYVEAATGAGMDTPVNYRTFHKRVTAYARTSALRNQDGSERPVEVSLRRVLSFDPKVAAEYLRRSIRVEGEGDPLCDAEVAQWNATAAVLRDALDVARTAQAAAAQVLSAAADALAAAQDANAPFEQAINTALAERNAADQAQTNARDAEQAALDRALQTLRNYSYFYNGTYYFDNQQRLDQFIEERDAYFDRVDERIAAETRYTNAVTAYDNAVTAAGDSRAAIAAAQDVYDAAAEAAQDATDDAVDAQRDVDDH